MYTFKLPNGVIHEGVTYDTVYMEEMTGKQQNYLINTKYKTQLDHIERILDDLVLSLNGSEGKNLFDILNKKTVLFKILPAEDITFILVKLREITFGESFFFDKEECPHCKHKGHYEIKLNKLEVIKGHNNVTELELPRSKKIAKFKPATYSDILNYAGDTEALINNATTATLSMVISELNGVKPTMEDIEGLKVMDIDYIINNGPKYNHLDVKITHKCTKCDKEFDTELNPLGVDFFVLSRAQKIKYTLLIIVR